MKHQGYYRHPTIHRNQIVFVCEDDLWTVPASGGIARRLTANPGRISYPVLSPDGQHLAYTSRDEGHPEVYVMDADSGEPRRLTYLGGDTRTVGWSPDGETIYYTSNAGSPFARVFRLGQVSARGGLTAPMPWGPASFISFGPRGAAVLGRHTWDPARWKRYRGGTTGQIWIDPRGRGQFRLLLQLDGNVTSPLWVGSRIYFGSDHEGVCNLYSCTTRGEDLRRHTDHHDFYLRFPSADGRRIVYQCGADLYVYDPRRQETRRVVVDFRSSRSEKLRKFVNSYTYFESYDCDPEGKTVSMIIRGRPFTFANWEQSVTQLGERDGVRYRLCRWLSDGERVICISDRLGEERLEVHPAEGGGEPATVHQDFDIGRPLMLEASPSGNLAILTNHRYELLLGDVEANEIRLIDRSAYDRIGGACFSPDGRWVAYSLSTNRQASVLKLFQVETGDIHEITRPYFKDIAPAFDPDGRYLYFLSYRDFDPVYDNLFFDLNFPKGMRPYLVTLQKDLPSPFDPIPRPPGEEPKKGKKKEDGKSDEEGANSGEEKDKKDEAEPIAIDVDGIAERILAFPVPEGRYGQIRGIKDMALFTSFPVQGSLSKPFPASQAPPAEGTLYGWDFKKLEKKELVTKVTNFRVSANAKALIYLSGSRLRVLQAGKKPENNDVTTGRKTGYINLNRVKVSVLPAAEWRQMYKEAWRLMRDQFWTSDMSGVHWEETYQQYLPLLDRVATRAEFSDLLWELQGELGTSHAYEFGGEYRPEPWYQMGKLGVDFEYDEEHDAYRFAHIVRGDSWNEEEDSPLNRPPARVSPGDLLLAVDGHRLGKGLLPQELLVNQGGLEVRLTILRQGEEEPFRICVKALRAETPARYREWVERNRRRVHEATGARVGYVHIPNMGPQGYAEFHRSYYSEVERDGLILDVRYNGGGHVSQLILEKLSRRRLGYDFNRWGAPLPYPQQSPGGPLVALTNELAGSDGDIFSHCFKRMELGPLIGKRTWGGVIGMWPRHRLVDGTQTTQPEFAFWFDDVGWHIENYGTDPDIEVEIAPHDWAAGRDPQLDRGIQEILRLLQEHPGLPEPGVRPSRARPRLPARED
ncbi:MAG: PD40 domain-containing protein [Armatimonadetes bacterium]|nr:PD40 domain-containing protein [Armatimonadota bacterium]